MRRVRAKSDLNKRRIAIQRGYAICTVNSFAIRDWAEKEEEFTNFATHVDFPKLIPSDEIWIDERLFAWEGVFYVANALVRLREQTSGRSEERSYKAGLRAEQMLREVMSGVKFRAGRPHKQVPERLYALKYTCLPDPMSPIEVWCVDGNLVRCIYKTDYCEGGHGYVYPWVPRHQIWIEKDLKPSEMPYIVSHEYLELRLMRDKGLNYDTAHKICAKVEFDLREGREVLAIAGVRGQNLRKPALSELTRNELFDYVTKHYCR